MHNNHAILKEEAEDQREVNNDLRQTLWDSVNHTWHVPGYIPRTDCGKYMQEGLNNYSTNKWIIISQTSANYTAIRPLFKSPDVDSTEE